MSKGWIFTVVIVVGLVALIVWNAVAPDMTVAVVRPQVQAVQAYIDEQAITELPHDFLISMPISGWLERIPLREGDSVSAGQVVARLETDDLRDRVRQVEQRIAELKTRLAETADHRLEQNALVQADATVKAIDETVRAAEAKLEAAQATCDFMKSEVERLRALSESDSAAQRELRKAELDDRKAQADYRSDLLDLAALKTIAAVSYIGPKFIDDYIDRKTFTLDVYRKQMEHAQADLEIATRNLQRAEVRSPISGVVLNRHQTRRQYLQAGTPLLTLGRLEDMEVIAEVLTQRAVHIELGDPVEVRGTAILTPLDRLETAAADSDGRAGIVGNGVVMGRVSRVYPAGFTKISSLGVEQQRVNVAVKLDNVASNLGVGYRLHVRIIHDEVHDALTLPRASLFRGRSGVWQAMVVRGEQTELRNLRIGLMNDELAQITGGLGADDLVVRYPSREIVPGLHVLTTDVN